MLGICWQIDLLGGLRARHDGRTITHFESRKSAALLACLALNLGRALPRDLLAEHLWPDEEFEATRGRLRQALSCLRHELEPDAMLEGTILVADRTEVRLAPQAVTTDVARFERCRCEAHRAPSPVAAVGPLRDAVELYRGDLLPGFYEECFSAQRIHLAEAHQVALSQLACALALAGDLVGAIEVARDAVAEDPLREGAQCYLMRLYAADGRTAEALRQYHAMECLIRRELSTTPSAASVALLAELRSGACGPVLTHSGGPPWSRPAQPSPATPPGARTSIGGVFPATPPEGGPVPLGSPFYLQRPVDTALVAAVAQGGGTVVISGPRRIGKTSLLARGLHQARAEGARIALSHIRKLVEPQLESADALAHALAQSITDQLGSRLELDQARQADRAWNLQLELALRRIVEEQGDRQFVWALDDVDRLLERPYSDDLFALLRSWHNERSLDPGGPWSRLTLIITHSTEPHLLCRDPNHSPFNVGTRLVLRDFTPPDLADLNRRYGSPLRDAQEIHRYHDLVGGEPFLVRHGLQVMHEATIGLDQLEAAADRLDGPFADDLRATLRRLRQDPVLAQAMREVLATGRCSSTEAFFRLRSAGLIAGQSEQEAHPRCGLYRRFLPVHLG